MKVARNNKQLEKTDLP